VTVTPECFKENHSAKLLTPQEVEIATLRATLQAHQQELVAKDEELNHAWHNVKMTQMELKMMQTSSDPNVLIIPGIVPAAETMEPKLEPLNSTTGAIEKVDREVHGSGQCACAVM